MASAKGRMAIRPYKRISLCPFLSYFGAMAAESNPQLIAGIRVRLLVIEEALRRMELWLTAPEAEPILEATPNDLTDLQKIELFRLIEKVRKMLKELKNKLNLEITSRPVKKRLLAEAARLWTVAGNLEAKRLKGYGPIPPEAAEAIHSPAEELQKIFKEMERILSM